MEAILDEFGRISIPQQVREDLGLAPGTLLSIEEREEGILLRPLPEASNLILEDGVLVFTGELEGDPSEVLQRVREERSRKMASGLSKGLA
jgi:AbrB family looped-hinge helix DNA binding protein